MGYSFQAIAMLIHGLGEQKFAIPMISRICEGIIRSSEKKISFRQTGLDVSAGQCNLCTKPYVTNPNTCETNAKDIYFLSISAKKFKQEKIQQAKIT